MNKSENFYELFRKIEDGINSNEIFDLHSYRKEAESLASKKADNAINLSIIIFMLSCLVISFQYLGGLQKNAKIQHLENLNKMLIEPTQDTIRFDCRRCGHSHNLATIDTLK